jgi:ribosomal protein S18 acetylase RimI-like enzyme
VSSYSAVENGRLRTRADRAVRNRRQKEKLVKNGRAHGVIVYTNRESVGWCQYGSREELPRMDNARNYRNLAPKDEKERLWRITCFVVDKNYRKSGVASTALEAALESIRN